jgi:hypothetical protein
MRIDNTIIVIKTIFLILISYLKGLNGNLDLILLIIRMIRVEDIAFEMIIYTILMEDCKYENSIIDKESNVPIINVYLILFFWGIIFDNIFDDN